MSQKSHQRLQVHYLLVDIQNEFIDLCAQHVVSAILKEREESKYYSIIVDATPNCSHVEQTSFVLRYVHYKSEIECFSIEERFLEFRDCFQKTGEAIGVLITDTLSKINFVR